MTSTITKTAEMGSVLPSALRVPNYVIPNGVNQDLFRPIPRSEARQALGWPDREHIVLFAATRPRDINKRLDLARAAISEAEKFLGSIRLMVAENQTPDSVPLMMNGADCLLLTSISEGSPNVIKEALMCNLPVVSTDVGDVRDLLREVQPSAVCDPHPEALGGAIVAILRAAKRSNGRDRHPELFESVVAGRLFDIYARAGYKLEHLSPTNR